LMLRIPPGIPAVWLKCNIWTVERNDENPSQPIKKSLMVWFYVSPHPTSETIYVDYDDALETVPFTISAELIKKKRVCVMCKLFCKTYCDVSFRLNFLNP
jgi:hypothetical protein